MKTHPEIVAAFEAWANERALDLTTTQDAWTGTIYKHPHIQSMWDGYSACYESLKPEIKEWEDFGLEIEKLLRHNRWGFKGSYPEIIKQLMSLVPENSTTVGSVIHQEGFGYVLHIPSKLAATGTLVLIPKQGEI